VALRFALDLVRFCFVDVAVVCGVDGVAAVRMADVVVVRDSLSAFSWC
jgi:hypothetical protein